MSEMSNRVATAIMNRRIQPNFYGVDEHGVSLFDTDAELARAAIQELGEPTAEMLKGGMEVLEESQKMGEPLEAQVGRVWWEMICIAQPAPGSTQEDQDRWDKIFAEAVAEVRAERT